jgi:hypothetical protein
MNDGHVSFRKYDGLFRPRIINGKIINPDDIDESFPFGVAEF